jgi:hypothetical protein
MHRSRLSVLLGMSLGLLTSSAFAQPQAAKPKVALDDSRAGDKAIAKEEAERIREGRRLQARSLLFSLSGDARTFSDPTLRARSLVRIADAVWGVAAEQGRALFREAWDAAEKADRESQEPLNLRREVLALAAKRDGQLAEEFLRKMKVEQQESKTEPAVNNAPPGDDLWELPGAAEKRLRLAGDLLSTGDVKSALQYGDAVLGPVTISTVEFLTQLRDKDPAAADQRYAAMLANGGANPAADANTVSLLASYLFTPHTYVVFNSAGDPSSSMTRTPYPPPNVSPQLRLAFFQAGGGILLRPLPPPDLDRSTTGVAGKFMALKRLLPLFERYAPPEIASAVRGQFESLNSLVSDGVRQADSEWVQKGIEPDRPAAGQERSLLDEIERAGTPAGRDQLYFRLATLALGNDEMKARDYVGKIYDSSFCKLAQAWVDWSLVIAAVKKKKVDAALELAKNVELTNIQRVWALTQTAKLLAKTDRDKALSLLDEAKVAARRLDRLDPDRPRGLLAVAGALKLLDPPRAWDAISDAVEAANEAESFTGEDGLLTATVNTKSQILIKRENVPDFDVQGVFGEVAGSDFDRAVLLAGRFKGEAPRVNAVIAVARAVLNEKSAPVTTLRATAKN